MKKIAAVCTALALVLCACTANESRRQIFLMDTVIDIYVQGEGSEQTVDMLENEFMNVEAICSPTDPDSEISRLNRAGAQGMDISSELRGVLEASAELTRETRGAFDISIGALVDLWNIGGEAPAVPQEDEIAKTAALCGMEKLKLSERRASVVDGARLNLGGIAKGYAAKRAMEILSQNRMESALVYIGGNICVKGGKGDGTPWNIGIRDPQGTAADSIGILKLTDTVVSASGDYERYFEKDGVRYHHIIDPMTGYPADSGLQSVTVVCDDGVRADALSTALFVMGEDAALELWRAGEDFECVLITRDMRVIVTSGLSDKYHITDGRYTLEAASR